MTTIKDYMVESQDLFKIYDMVREDKTTENEPYRKMAELIEQIQRMAFDLEEFKRSDSIAKRGIDSIYKAMRAEYGIDERLLKELVYEGFDYFKGYDFSPEEFLQAVLQPFYNYINEVVRLMIYSEAMDIVYIDDTKKELKTISVLIWYRLFRDYKKLFKVSKTKLVLR